MSGVGVVVNPIAGMGGRVALHGTDGAALAAARRLGAGPVAPHRARRALHRLRALAPDLPVLTVAGQMGADHLPDGAARGPVRTLERIRSGPTTAADTRDAVHRMVGDGVSLVLFVGGDGTARDVLEVAGGVPVLGVPSGVKMHSGVFADGPEAAAVTAARFAADPARVGCAEVEVVDLADGATRVYGVARVPRAGAGAHHAKAASPRSDHADLVALGRQVAAGMADDRLYLLGPGTTVSHVSAALDLPASLLGVDAVHRGRLLASDATEADLLALLDRHPAATVILGVVGGQGFLLGRGNQQISAAVLDRVGPANVEILAARGKIAMLDPPVLRVDLGDEHPRNPLTGYRRVRTAPGHSTVLRVIDGS